MSLLNAALEYAHRGWAVLPLHSVTAGQCSCGKRDCKSPGKHPMARLVPNGVLNATTDQPTVTQWFTNHPTANIGIATGPRSNLVVIDLDDRPLDGRDGSVSWRRLLTVHQDGQSIDTVEAITGGGGRHVFFQCPPHPPAQSKDVLGLGVEVKSEGGYVVAAPSVHQSGRSYEWELSSHPDDVVVAPFPEWLATLTTSRTPQATRSAPRPAGALDALEVVELRSALAALPSDDRDQWVTIGMALHAANDDDRALPLWLEWSATSAKFDHDDAIRVWNSFHPHEAGVTLATLYHHAQKAGWARPSLESVLRAVGYEVPDFSALLRTRPAALVAPTDPLVHSLPGHIETIAQWSYQSAPRPDHVYAVAAALMLASTLAGRRYVTAGNNYGTLYFLVVGKSGTGKEHIRTTVETILRAVNAADLIGPNQFTSSSAVWSALLTAPQSIAIVDEFGQFLAAASGGSDGAQMKDGVLTTLMELWGRVAGVAQTPQFATLALSGKQREAMQRKSIERPALAVGGLTTPAMFYQALKSSRVASGFLNRYCILHGVNERKPFTLLEPTPVPASVASWGAALLEPHSPLDVRSRLTELPPATRLTLPDQTRALFAAFDTDCMAEADRLEGQGLGELPMRAAEQAMRLALVASLADDPTVRHISPQFASWGVDVARWMLFTLIPTVQAQMAENPLHALRNRFLQALKDAGDRGMSERELKRSPLFVGVPRRERDDAVAWVMEAHYAEWTMRTHTGAGRPTRALRIMANHDLSEAA